MDYLNGMYASKAPKRICYSASESLKNRVAATVAQKNIGYHYISDLHVETGLSPNKVTKTHCQSLCKERKRQLTYSQQPDVKKRKMKIYTRKNRTLARQEKLEGTTYKSDIGFTLISEITDIPPIRYRPFTQPIRAFEGNFATSDHETSSLQEDCEVLQIACKNDKYEFSCYIQPTKTISKMSSSVTGLTNEEGIIFHNGHPIQALNRKAAFQSFVLWICQFKPVILVGHNSKLFDSRRLLANINFFIRFAELRTIVTGFVDTLQMLKKLLPDLESYKQANVYKHNF